MSMLDAIPKCFSESYDEARRKFLNAGDDIGLTPKSYANPLTGPNGGTLATDCLWIGPEDAEKVLVHDLCHPRSGRILWLCLSD